MSKITGTGIVVASGDVLTLDESVPSHDLGELVHLSDGRAFRYVLAGGTDLVRGNLIQSQAQATDSQSLIVAAAAIGALEITTTDTTTVTANEFAGGWVLVTGEASTGRGQLLRIKSHPAATAAVVTLTLEDPVQVALTATSQIDLVHNPYSGVIQNPTTATGSVVGVAISPIAASQYGFIQVRGVAPVLAQGALTIGTLCVASNGVAGAVELSTNASTEAQQPVGTATTGVADTENGAVLLNLA